MNMIDSLKIHFVLTSFGLDNGNFNSPHPQKLQELLVCTTYLCVYNLELPESIVGEVADVVQNDLIRTKGLSS